MTKRSVIAMGILALAFLATAQQTQTSRTIKVKLNYTGSGTVDEQHKIFVFLFDSPDFMQGNGMPIANGSASAKNGTVTISGVSASPVYIAAAFDPSGGYDGTSGPPPQGSSLGVYSDEPGKPAPVNIEGGKTAEVELPFDDAHKMQ